MYTERLINRLFAYFLSNEITKWFTEIGRDLQKVRIISDDVRKHDVAQEETWARRFFLRKIQA